jgi:hypothetical protein
MIITLLLVGCSTPKITKLDTSISTKNIKSKSIKSILVLPATDNTLNTNLSYYYSYTITESLIDKGYYIFPIHLVEAFLKSENISSAKIAKKIDITKLKEVFDADAILYVDIYSLGSELSLNKSQTSVDIIYELVDTSDGSTLWSKIVGIKNTTRQHFSNMVAIAVSSVLNISNIVSSDYLSRAYEINNIALSTLPNNSESKANRYYIDIKTPIKKIIDNRVYVIDSMIEGNSDISSNTFFIHSVKNGKNIYTLDNLSHYPTKQKIAITHSGYQNYYYKRLIENKYILKNRFFYYDKDNRAYMIYDKNRVYIKTNPLTDKIEYQKDTHGYYFTVDKDI